MKNQTKITCPNCGTEKYSEILVYQDEEDLKKEYNFNSYFSIK